MSLAEEFLADIEDVDAEEELVAIKNDALQTEIKELNNEDIVNKRSIKFLTKLLGSDRLNEILAAITDFKNNEEEVDVNQLSKEYDLIVKSNKMMVDIEDEINIIHKFLRDIYNKRFPELESLVTDSYDYIQTVHFLGNINDDVKVDNIEFLTPALKMVVSVTISTTIGEPLNTEDVGLIEEACQMAADLSRYRAMLFEYIQSRMIFIAPNLSHMVGPTLAAQLIGSAGGLLALAKMPACNTQLVGAKKNNLVGFSGLTSLPHTGILYHSEFIQKLPLLIRKKCTRLFAAKCSLAARMDQQRECQDGTYGEKLMDEIKTKIDKLMEPPPVKAIKPLPRPDDMPRRKRGGKRQRKAKEKIGLSELRKQANTIKFGQIQEDVCQDSVGFGFGTIGQSGTGKIRNSQLDSKTKVNLSKRLQRNLASMNTSYGAKSTIKGQVSGTATSVAFTPFQGIEIVNPQAADGTATVGTTSTVKYFSSATGFKSTIPKP